jgi:hypothetical protein
MRSAFDCLSLTPVIGLRRRPKAKREMGLDIFAGTLSRYYSRDWQTVVQSAGGLIVYPDGEPEKVSFEDAHFVVDEWRKSLNIRIDKLQSNQLVWNEELSTPYFTDKPDFEGWLSLQLWAAYVEEPEAKRPLGRVDDAVLGQDKVYQRAISKSSPNPLVATLRCELFVPSELTFLFEAELPNGRQAWIGTTSALRAVLHTINVKSWQVTPKDLEEWMISGLPADVAVEISKRSWSDFFFLNKRARIFSTAGPDRMQQAAKFGFGVFKKAIDFSDEKNVPIILDY